MEISWPIRQNIWRFGRHLTMGTLLTLFWAAGCTQSEPEETPGKGAVISHQGQYRVEAHFQPNPPRAGWNALEIRLFDADGLPLNGVDLVVKPWMTAMNHGSNPSTVTLIPAGGNLYTTDSVRFTMPGSWEVLVFLSQGNSSDTATVLVEVE